MKPLTLKQERAKKKHAPVSHFPVVTVLVDHGVLHLPATYQYLVPEDFNDSISIGVLVEVEFGKKLCAGVVIERLEVAATFGNLKYVEKVLSRLPYLAAEQLKLLETAAESYGTGIWDILRSTVPPYSSVGERNFAKVSLTSNPATHEDKSGIPSELISSLSREGGLHAALTISSSTPYWKAIAEVAIARLRYGEPHSKVLVITPNDRELTLLIDELGRRQRPPIVISAQQGKSERYANYLLAQHPTSRLLVGTRSSSLIPLPVNSTIIVQDDVDESHYERGAPTWNTRKLVSLREQDHSTLFVSATLSLETAQRVISGSLKHYIFPALSTPKIRSASTHKLRDFYPVIKRGLTSGSVLVNISRAGYISTFSCQRCRNIAQCSCGGRLYFPERAAQPQCSLCTTAYPDWECSWCQGSTPRIVSSGALRIAEELGPAFPGISILKSTGENPIARLPSGNHLVISTYGVEPRGVYSAQVFLDLESKLLRTRMRSTEEVRYEVLRTLTMLKSSGEIYVDLENADPFVQMLMRRNVLESASREIAERNAAELPPNFVVVVLTGPNFSSLSNVVQSLPDVVAVGPFHRRGQPADIVSMLLKTPSASAGNLIKVLNQINRVRSARKELLFTFRVAPYDLNA